MYDTDKKRGNAEMAKVIAISNQKGGVGKTTTTVNLAVALAYAGKKVLCVDLDPQGNLTSTLSKDKPKHLKMTITSAFDAYCDDNNDFETFDTSRIIMRYEILGEKKSLDFIPANLTLAGKENKINAAMARERLLENIVAPVAEQYDFILIDCMPSLSILTINAFAYADAVLIPVQPEEYSVNGLEALLNTVIKAKKNLNRKLIIEGVLITLLDSRVNQHKGLVKNLKEEIQKFPYADKLFKRIVFESEIPRTIKVSEAINKKLSVIEYSNNSPAALAYEKAAEEILEANC